MPSRPSIHRSLFISCCVLAALAYSVPAAAEEAAREDRRLIAIADIHGAIDELKAILQQVELIDKRGRWQGGDSIFVQTGDFLDRGAGTIEVARLLKRMQEQAPKQGGEVIVLLGNHEALNLIGDLRYITRDILSPFVDSRSEARYITYCNNYSKFVRRHAVLRGEDPPKAREISNKCQGQQAYGLIEYIEEMSPQGELGAWLRTLPATTQVGPVVFLHGGISPQMSGLSLDAINRQVADELAAFDRVRQRLLDERHILSTTHLKDIMGTTRQLAEAETAASGNVSADLQTVIEFQNSALVSSDGPLWFRGYGKWTEKQGLKEMPGILEPLAATLVVVGHTPQHAHEIVPRFDNQVLLIDTGMLAEHYKGRPSAIEIIDGKVYSHYLGQDRQEILSVQAAP